jgi:hypothetical protein
MFYWDRFCQSGKIQDYLDYRKYEKGVSDNDNLKGTDSERGQQG